MRKGRRRYPIGIQSFREIREENYYYVDKTAFVEKLSEEGKYYFLSRPRRFGKSLFIDTLKQAFLGRKELFEGLYLEKRWNWSKSYPVIHLSFGQMVSRSAEILEELLLSLINEQAYIYDIVLQESLIERRFYELIVKLFEKFREKVVILVDEYDKPLLDRIEDRELALSIREVLRSFYSVLKEVDFYLKFVFITGVSKFSKVSLFSGLNQLQDITLNPSYATICGYTQGELERVFDEEIGEEENELIRCWYNGYSFCGEPVYNPFDVLLYLSERQFRPYWFETGTPSFLIKLLFEKRFFLPEMETLIATERLLGSFDVDFIEPENLLFQAGYLTIKGYEASPKGLIYYLGYPNREVRISLNEYLAAFYTQQPAGVERLGDRLRRGLEKGEVEVFERVLRTLFSGIPYEWHRKNELAGYEGYYASVVYSFLVGTGLDVQAEDYTSQGRIDLVVKVGERVFVVEFKVVETEGERPKALEVIKNKGYAEKFQRGCREVYLVGIDFSKAQKNIINFEWERLINTL